MAAKLTNHVLLSLLLLDFQGESGTQNALRKTVKFN